MIRLLEPSEALERWRGFYGLVEPELWRCRGQLNMRSLVHNVAVGSYRMWINEDPPSVLFTMFVNYPDKRVCRMLLTVATMEVVRHGLPVVEQWAADNGCDEMELWGRDGWVKTFRDYEKTHVIMTKCVKHDVQQKVA